jgi:hypothetical protein
MSERCSVCGQTTGGLTHSWPGPLPSASVPENVWLPPANASPMYYFRLAIAIARLDEAAVVGASKDAVALLYGAAIWIISSSIVFIASFLMAAPAGRDFNFLIVAVGLCFGLVLAGILTLAQYGISHLLARWWFGARGTYLGILRPMLMGSIVSCLAVIPFVGTIAAGLWSIAILMRVFEEVDRIERMRAFMLSFGVGLVFWIIALSLTGPKH